MSDDSLAQDRKENIPPPGGARMDPSNVEPAAPNRRQSSDARKERQEVPTQAGRHHENFVLAQPEILSDVVNRETVAANAKPLALPNVDCDESVPPGTHMDDSRMNRTLTMEDLETLRSLQAQDASPTFHDGDPHQGDSARGKPPACDIDVAFGSPSELDYSFKTTTENTSGELEQTLYFDALNVGGTVDAESAEVKQSPHSGKRLPSSGAPSEPPPEPVHLPAEGLNSGGDEEPASFSESPRVMSLDNTFVNQSSQSPLQLQTSPLPSLNGSRLYDENVNLLLIDQSLLESPPRTAPQDCNDNHLIPEQASAEVAIVERSSSVAADVPLDPTSNSPSPLIQLSSKRPRPSLLAADQGRNNCFVAPGAPAEDADATHGTLQAVSGTLDVQGGTAATVNKKPPEVYVLPEAVEGTDVCTAASEPQPQDSEAGPEVAQFSKEEFLSVAASLKDPSDLDFLQKVGNSERLQRTRLGRCSLFLKFDPLLSELRPACHSPAHSKEEQQPEEQQSAALNCSGGTLIDFVDSPLKVRKSSSKEGIEAAEPMFSEKEMTQALKYQELMFQERLLKKDQDYMKEQDKLREEAEAWRAKFEHLGGLYEQQENTMMMLKSHNEQIVSAIERHVLGKKKDTDEKTASLQKITKERDQLAGDLHNMEIAFADFHRRYEKAKQAISTLKENESILKQQLADYREGVEKSNQMFNLLKAKTEESLEGASKEIEDSKKNFQADITVLRGQLKKAEMDNSCLEKRLEQKTEENAQLAKLYDDLLSQVKAK
ncbi:uncharacterized protein LOC8026898 isoform X1 [Ixodes scapularis]|uniref:uncharacterized protein LOC8026898 isoform X1 n=2 Tax=Ixodes scapularis TaxID=6945 RepID=UPI001A9E01CA|nr:uncharacterized protein LOC8026898 isoform X1 [Ixodes scapularis]XP_029836065.2 uncharacterized protein LOC8026898 isoform X1 [Ixodes scapularis]